MKIYVQISRSAPTLYIEWPELPRDQAEGLRRAAQIYHVAAVTCAQIAKEKIPVALPEIAIGERAAIRVELADYDVDDECAVCWVLSDAAAIVFNVSVDPHPVEVVS